MSVAGWGFAGLSALVLLNVAAQYLKVHTAKTGEEPVADTSVPERVSTKPNTEWVEAIIKAAGTTAKPEFLLKHIRNGSSPAEVMADRIKELEGEPAKA